MKKGRFYAFISFLAVALLGLVGGLIPLGVLPVAAAEPEVLLTTSFPSIVVDKTKNVFFSIDVTNKGQVGRSVSVAVTDAPKGWDPVLKSSGFIVRELYVPAGKAQSIDFQAKPPADVKAQDYAFLLKATSDGGEQSLLKLTVGVQDQIAKTGVSLVTQYPSLRGPAKNKYEFKVDLKNEGDDETAFNLASTAPDGWEVSFQPSYEQKQISTLRVKAGETSGVNVQITPPQRAEAGEYPVSVTASAGNDRATANLNVVLTGSYEMSVSTSSGRLNAQVEAGGSTTTAIIVGNAGSAELKDITFSSSKPDGWTITFNPDKLDSLPVATTREVNVTLKPSNKAIAGDYVVSLTTSNAQTSDRKDFRVTVDTPTTWGLVSVLIVVVVVGGLMGLFWQMSRR